MMFRISYFCVFVGLGTIGCSDNRQQNSNPTATKAAAAPEAKQSKSNPAPSSISTAPAEPPAAPVSAMPVKRKPKPNTNKIGHVAAPTVQCDPACELAMEILKLSPAERVVWANQEFAKRGINDVSAHQ